MQRRDEVVVAVSVYYKTSSGKIESLLEESVLDFRDSMIDERLEALGLKRDQVKLFSMKLFEKRISDRTLIRTWVCASSGREVCVSEWRE